MIQPAIVFYQYSCREYISNVYLDPHLLKTVNVRKYVMPQNMIFLNINGNLSG